MSKHLEVIANHPILRAYPITRQNKTNQTPVREGLFWVYLVKVVPIKVSPFWTQQREASIMDWFMSSALPCSSADFPSTDADASPSRTSRFRASFCFRRSLTEALKPLIFSFETKRVGRSHRTLLNSRVGSTIGYISWLIAGWTVGLMIDISHYVSWELSGYKVIHQQTFQGGHLSMTNTPMSMVYGFCHHVLEFNHVKSPFSMGFGQSPFSLYSYPLVI